MYMILYSMIGLESTPFNGAVAEHPHAVHLVSVRLGYVCAPVQVIIQMLDINFKHYCANKHNLLTTSYLFDESGCEYSWINWLSGKINSFKTIVVFMVNNLCCCDPYLRMVSILK